MDANSQPAQPSFSSRFAADWALHQSKLIASGSWLGSIASALPTYAQLRS